MPEGKVIWIPVSPGDLADRLTILEIKQRHLADEAKLANVRREHALLSDIFRTNVERTPELDRAIDRLRLANEEMWEQLDVMWAGHGTVELHRENLASNRRRVESKHEIDRLLGSDFTEEKSYVDH